MSKINGVSNITQAVDYENSDKIGSRTGNKSFSTYLNENKSLDEIFERAAKKYNVPVSLLKAIGKAESDFNPNAVSKAGAQGVMQLMPGTAKELGVTDPFDPEQNIMGGSKYIADLLKRYKGDTKLALAAYNAGMGNVKKYGGVPPFKETQNYVVKVMKYMEQDITAGTVKSTRGSQTVNIASRTYKSLPTVNNISNLHIPTAFSTGRIGTDSIADVLEVIFSYQDYLDFIDIFLKNREDKDEENKNQHNIFLN